MEERSRFDPTLTKDGEGWNLLANHLARLTFHDSTPKEQIVATINQAIQEMKEAEWFRLLPEGNENDYDQDTNNIQ
jgi:hypothetical protein